MDQSEYKLWLMELRFYSLTITIMFIITLFVAWHIHLDRNRLRDENTQLKAG